jgi:hypothetical protein
VETVTELPAEIEKPRPLRLSGEIEALLEKLSERPVTLREIIAVTHSRAYTLLLILLSIPFCLPIPVPGLSVALGALIALIGLRLSLRAEPWLPDAVLDAQVSSGKVALILKGGLKLAKGLEVFLKPRLTFLVDYAVLHHFYGAMICISGLLLLLPLPIPFSNLIPALSIIFLSAAFIERDGYAIIAGTIMFALTIVFFWGIFSGSAAMIGWVRDWFGGAFDPQERLPEDFPLPLPADLPLPMDHPPFPTDLPVIPPPATPAPL